MPFDLGSLGLSAWYAATSHTHQKADNPEDPDQLDLGKWLRIGHLSATVTIAIFLWQQHTETVKTAVDVEKRIAVLEAKQALVIAENARQDSQRSADISILNRSLELLHEDVVNTKNMVFMHDQRAAQAFERKHQ